MAIAHDFSTRFPATDGVSGTNSVDTTTGDRSFTHNPVGVPKGVVVVIVSDTQPTAVVSGVTYGGIGMWLQGTCVDTSEAGAIWIYTLTDTVVPTTDPATVVLQGCTATPKWVTCSTVTAATTHTTVNTEVFINTTTAIDALVTLTTTQTTMSYGAACSGLAAPPTTMKTGCTIGFQNDTGTRAQSSCRRTSADAAGSITLGFTTASEDWCAAGIALCEYTPPVFPPQPLIGIEPEKRVE